MLKWQKTRRLVRNDGSGVTTYTARGKRQEYTIESRKNAIEHAGRSGVWYHTEFVLIAGTFKNGYNTLKRCKEVAEEMEAQA